MPKRTLGSLGALVKNKRGARKLREVAKEIGIGPLRYQDRGRQNSGPHHLWQDLQMARR